MTERVAVRLARPADSAAVAALLVEGFGRDYGGALLSKGGQRMMQRISALPGRLSGVFLAIDEAGTPIGMAGLRTTELRPTTGWQEEQIQMEELGLVRAFWLELRSELTEPRSYHLRHNEALIYSVVVTGAWRGRGVGDQLLTVLHAEAARRGKRRVLLEVVENNLPALHLYRRHGYTLVKRRRGTLAWLHLGVAPRLLLARPLEQADM